MNIIADVAGQYDALMRLVAKMPKDPFIFVGDLIDRGPKSKEVVEWVMKNARSVLGNHEDMMIDFYRDTDRYEDGIWFMNGGETTAQSYVGRKIYANKPSHHELIRKRIPEEHIIWMENLPTEIRTDDGLLVTHAAYNSDVIATYDTFGAIWYRGEPVKQAGIMNVFGHNSHWGITKFEDYAMCIDGSRHNVLTGLHWPSMTIYQEPYEKS